MKKPKKEKPVYAYDKYGLLYQVNKPLSENDKALLENLGKIMKKNNK
jgi:hypothetical protein